MHFVTGGAYNGKAKWVKKHDRLDLDHVQWISAYRDEPLSLHFHEDTVVLQGIEAWIKRDASNQEAAVIRLKWQEIINRWRIWEEAKNDRQFDSDRGRYY